MSAPSLLSFLETPLVVGDPEGRTAYVNPTFESRFSVSGKEMTGQPLASLFDGGVREAVLRAVAEVCRRGGSERFRVRHGGVGYAVLASPIEAEDANVGVVILFSESAAEDERVHMLRRTLAEASGEVARVLDELADRTGGAADGDLLEDGIRNARQLCKAVDDLGAVLSGRPAAAPHSGGFDPAPVARTTTARMAEAFALAGARFDVRLPETLPHVAGDADAFRELLRALLDMRLEACHAGSKVVVAAKPVERAGAESVVFAVADAHPDAPADLSAAVPPLVQQRAEALGAEIRATSDPKTGRTTAVRLPVV